MRRSTTSKTLTILTLVYSAFSAVFPPVAGAAVSDYFEPMPWYSYFIAALALACAVLLLMWLFAHRGKAKVDLISEVLSENIAKPEIAEKAEKADGADEGEKGAEVPLDAEWSEA